MTVKVLDLVGSVTEVAVNVAVLAAPTVAGALYVIEVVDAAVSEPRPVTADQLTPALPGSLFAVAVISCVVFWSMVNGLVGENVTLIAGLIEMLSPVVVAALPTESTSLTVNG